MKRAKLVYINIDGFSYSYLERLHSANRDMGFRRLQKQGFIFTDLHSGLISITSPMQGAILSGAWSNRTHNFYQHYDREQGVVIRHGRTCDAQNVAQAMQEKGLTVASIHQFMLENHPCVDGEKNCAYFRCAQEPSNSFGRFEILKDLAMGRPVRTGYIVVQYLELPDLTALYVDDIDALGHNQNYGPYPRRSLLAERQNDIDERLESIQLQLEEFVDICKSRGFFDDLIILVTTDHGMTPFWGPSDLPDFMSRLERAGLKTDIPENRTAQTKLVAVIHDMELCLYALAPLCRCEVEALYDVCEKAEYVERVFDKAEMELHYGLDSRGPDFMVNPVYGHHFSDKNIPAITYAASHDSFDETSQHIFGMLLGGKVAKLKTYDKPTAAIDLMPTILKKEFGIGLRESTGKIHDGWFNADLCRDL